MLSNISIYIYIKTSEAGWVGAASSKTQTRSQDNSGQSLETHTHPEPDQAITKPATNRSGSGASPFKPAPLPSLIGMHVSHMYVWGGHKFSFVEDSAYSVLHRNFINGLYGFISSWNYRIPIFSASALVKQLQLVIIAIIIEAFSVVGFVISIFSLIPILKVELIFKCGRFIQLTAYLMLTNVYLCLVWHMTKLRHSAELNFS